MKDPAQYPSNARLHAWHSAWLHDACPFLRPFHSPTREAKKLFGAELLERGILEGIFAGYFSRRELLGAGSNGDVTSSEETRYV